MIEISFFDMYFIMYSSLSCYFPYIKCHQYRSSASRRPRLRRHPRKAKPFNTKYCINREQQ
nr:hypothetical protein E1951_08960 [Staphylococcus aureus]